MKKTVMALVLGACAAVFAVMPSAALHAGAESAGYKALYCADYHSGTAIKAENETEHYPIASMCKIMTLLLCYEAESEGNLSFDERISVSERASGMGGSQVFLEAGAEYPAGELIKSICIASANDSCVAMAERLCGSEELFVDKMNDRAHELGMNDTLFVNCTGLPAPGQYSCAKDVAKMLSELLRHENYFKYSKIWMDKMQHPEGRVTEMANTNKMIRSYSGCDAGKTGFTNDAGFCLAASAMRGNMRVVSVVIGADSSKTRFETTKESFDYAFANYTNKSVLDGSAPLDEKCPVTGGKKSEIAVRPERSSYIFCARNDKDDIFYEIEFNKVKAPVAERSVVGQIVVYKNNIEADRLALVANEYVARSSYWDALRDVADGWII